MSNDMDRVAAQMLVSVAKDMLAKYPDSQPTEPERKLWREQAEKRRRKEGIRPRKAAISRQEILKGLNSFNPALDDLNRITELYDKYWSFGNTPDPVLDDMLKMASRLDTEAKALRRDLMTKMHDWGLKSRQYD